MQSLRRTCCRNSISDYEFQKNKVVTPGRLGRSVLRTDKDLAAEKQSTASSHKIALEIRVFCRCDFLGRTVEINAAFVVNDETRYGLVEIGLNARGRSRIANHAPRLRIEFKIGEREAILDSMRGEQRSYAVNVAEAKDQSDDRLRRNGIEPRGGRIVKNDLRAADEGACDGNAAAHATGKFGRKLIESVFELDEFQDFADALVDFGFIDAIFAETVGDVVGDGHGVEERAFLEDEADLAAEIEEIDFGHG